MVFGSAGLSPSFFCLIIYFTKILAYAGFVNATYLSIISSSVSISSSMVANGVLAARRDALRTCTVGATSPICYTLLTCNCFKKWAHFVTPSISSKLRSLFLKPSIDRNRE
jgi:hypothetical protein